MFIEEERGIPRTNIINFFEERENLSKNDRTERNLEAFLNVPIYA